MNRTRGRAVFENKAKSAVGLCRSNRELNTGGGVHFACLGRWTCPSPGERSLVLISLMPALDADDRRWVLGLEWGGGGRGRGLSIHLSGLGQ